MLFNSLFPKKNEAQKVRHEKNKSNVTRIQLQNLYKVNSEDPSDIKMIEMKDPTKATETEKRHNEQI